MATPPNTVAQIMTKDVLTLTEDQDLSELDRAMRLLRFRHMPVTQDGRLVGLVSQSDILRIAASSLLPNSHAQTELLTHRYHVRDIMTTGVRTVSSETPVTEAARLMHREKLGCLPVVDANNVLVGILTEADFVLLALRLIDRGKAAGSPPRPPGN